jgi:hypothetical protein
MICPGRDRFALVCLALLAPALAGACGGSKAPDVCALASCTSGASLQISLSSSVAAMTQPKFTVCRNDVACYDWLPGPLPSTGSGGTVEAISTVADITGTFWRNSDGTVTLDIEWAIADESQLVDGDHYVVTLADGTGAPTTVLDKLATYVRNAPGGADCGPVCLQVTLSA